MPGVASDGVNINLEGDQLTIEGRVKAEDYEGLKPLYVEYNVGGYFRRFTVGEAVDRDGIKAQLKNGVLALRLPKAERARARRIAVQAA
jgi:HSP20 family molecular chaperone IbpA